MKLNELRPDLLSPTSEGSIRIAGTRVTIEAIVQGFLDGATPEEICQDFPSLALPQVYDVLAFYLTHQHEVETYLREQAQITAEIRKSLETTHTAFVTNLRQRLTARRSTAAPHA
ncbi:MAG: DUF433 domain-containing protein [Nitrospiraceae bacterium]|nr:DUF433 domain-containing protein [Nitrospiraceae bacterium]